jgi:hypothetical protein
MKTILLFISISIASGLLFVNLYTSLVDAKSWGGDIPNSIATAREYYKSVNPGDFFRIFSPINQVAGLVVLILFWKASASIRLYLGAAFILYVLGDVFTFAFFYPRNDVMFTTAQLTDVALLKKTWTEWDTMNWLRSLIILAGLCFSFLSLHKLYSRQEKKQVQYS